MVGLRAKVLGRMGWTTSPHPRAGALSCPLLAVYWAGAFGLWPFALGRVTDCFLGASIQVKHRSGPSWAYNSLWPLPRLLSGRAASSLMLTGAAFILPSMPRPSLRRRGPSLCPGPMLQGVSYVHHEPASLYIRNIIPTGGAYPASGPGLFPGPIGVSYALHV